MTNAGLEPGNPTIVYSYGDTLHLTITVTGMTLGGAASFIVRTADGAGASTLLTLTSGNGKAAVNTGAGTVTLSETAANMSSAFSSWGDYPYWLQVTDAGGNEQTILAGTFRVLEAHQS